MMSGRGPAGSAAARAPEDGRGGGDPSDGYSPTSRKPEPGGAPGLKSRVVAGGDGAPRTFALVFGKGDEVMSGLTDWAKREGIRSARLQGIGAFSSALLAWFDRDRKAYRHIPVDGIVECVSLLGDVGLAGDEPALHVHASVGFPDGALKGGHLLEARVFPTLEIFATEGAVPLLKAKDEETGLALIDLDRR